MFINFVKSISLSYWTLFVVTLFCIVFSPFFINWSNFNSPFHDDVDQYYSYLITTFKHHDLYFENGTYGFWYAETPLGKLVPKVTYGMGLFYLPFFLIAELFSNSNSTGYEPIYAWSIHIGSMLYSLIGLYIINKILLNWFSEKVTALTLLILFFGTNLFCYTLIQPELTHGVLFMLNALFVFYVLKWYQKFDKKYFLIYCFILGLITLIRPTEIVILLFPLLIGISTLKDFVNRIHNFITLRFYFILGILLFLIPLFPQLLYWKIQSGSWLFFSYGSGERFFWADPQFINVLFSYRKGWLIYSPIMLLSLIGFFFLYKKNRSLFLPILLYFVINLYFISSWWDWGFGGSFGMRALVQVYAVLIIPFAYTVQWITINLKLTWTKYCFYICMLFLCLLNIFQSNLYKHNIIHYDGMTKEAYWFTFFKKNYTKKDFSHLDSLIKRPNYALMKAGFRNQ